MTTKYNGGAAFPHRGWDGPNDQFAWPESGMSLRDWFAGQAINGLLSHGQGMNSPWVCHPPSAAEWAYAIADAMIAERSK